MNKILDNFKEYLSNALNKRNKCLDNYSTLKKQIDKTKDKISAFKKLGIVYAILSILLAFIPNSFSVFILITTMLSAVIVYEFILLRKYKRSKMFLKECKDKLFNIDLQLENEFENTVYTLLDYVDTTNDYMLIQQIKIKRNELKQQCERLRLTASNKNYVFGNEIEFDLYDCLLNEIDKKHIENVARTDYISKDIKRYKGKSRLSQNIDNDKSIGDIDINL